MSDDPKRPFSESQPSRVEKCEERSSLTQRIRYLEQELAENRKKLKELNDAASELALDESGSSSEKPSSTPAET